MVMENCHLILKSDLIETLWNVKAWGFAVLCRSRNDLIETLWNVKIRMQLIE